MKKTLLLIVAILTIGQTFAQKRALWNAKEATEVSGLTRARTNNVCRGELYFTLDLTAFRQTLANAADKFSNTPGIPVTLPNLKGEMETFLVWENSNFTPEMQARFPEIRAYVGRGVTDKAATLNLSVSPQGIQTMVFRAENGTEFIEGYDKAATAYVVFNSNDRVSGRLPFNCATNDVEVSNDLANKVGNTTLADNIKYKTFRLALSCTAEYSNYFGATSSANAGLVLAAMNATMTRVNGVMEKDLSVHLNIIPTDDQVIYYDADTDPYSPVVDQGGGFFSAPVEWNDELMNNLHSTLGDTAFDIGHLFGANGGGGNAGCIGCVCSNTLSTGGGATDSYKGGGYTSPSDAVPAGDTFDIDYVVHEMGHQLGANHTFTYAYEGSGAQIEPGSGSTIMAYAGVATTTSGVPAYNVQSHSDALYCNKSISQIQTRLNNASASCAVTTDLTGINATPTVSTAASAYTIPIGTAFKLTGSGTDANAADVLTYCWEQNNTGTTATTDANSRVLGTKTTGPNFKIFPASTSPTRYFPQMSKVLTGNLVVATASDANWESCSSVARTLSFALTVRDNHPGMGQTKISSNVTVTVLASAGPFKVTSQNTASYWTQGQQQTITWDVANTTALPNSANVNIKLSTDGGLNFDTILASNTPNDGSETITVPAVSALNCRIMVESAGNIYFAVNSRAFSIGANCKVYTATPNAAIADGTGANTAGATTTSVLNVPDAFNISGLKVNLKIDHAKIGDLVVKIAHPDGTVRTLWNRSCNSSTVTYSGLDLTFADGSSAIATGCASPTVGVFNASQSSSALVGYNNKTSAGNWTLTVTDNAATNTGTLVTWGLDFGCTLATNNFEINNLSIYPNPNRGNFNIQFDNPSASEVKVAVYDMRGRKIFENNYANQANFNENIQLDNAQAGIYLVNVIDGSKKITKKIVVE